MILWCVQYSNLGGFFEMEVLASTKAQAKKEVSKRVSVYNFGKVRKAMKA